MDSLYVALVLLCLLLLGVYLTNPFSRYTVVRRTYRARMERGVLEAIDENRKLVVRQNPLVRAFAVLASGIHILSSRYHHRPASQSSSVDEIIEDIYDLRFDPTKLLLTSGDHFSALFVRNLGVFYYPTLDRRLPASQERWHDRQLVYLQTVAYALGVFAKQPTLTTTIVPTSRYGATCVNFYAYPSDTLYGILYAVAALAGHESGRAVSYQSAAKKLATKASAEMLLKNYGSSLAAHYQTYKATVYDEATGLISRQVRMSGAKDITKRESAFYDNVIFYKTTELAAKLGLIEPDDAFLSELKQRIIATFWLEEEGYFIEDLSPEAAANSYYSSDWLIVLATGFLSLSDKNERRYYERSVKHIQAEQIDMPFAIKYHNDTRAHRQFAAVRLAVASYGGDSIWSFWGMEYIKVLLGLYQHTGEEKYLKSADYHIARYEAAIVKNRGFPEVYDSEGRLLETPLYRSIRQTGWVIGFDQVRAIRRDITPQ